MYDNELKLFQRNNDGFIWTDDHIGSSMLEAHLNEDHDAASRRNDKRVIIENWINKTIKANSKILDLGCGPGLYAYELGQMGHTVLGLDINKASLEYAQKNKSILGKIEYKHCNYIKDPIEGKFDVAMMIYYDFGVLFPDDQKLLLKKLNNLLEDDGLFIFDVYENEEIKKKKEYRNWYISQGGDFWSKDPYFMMEETKVFLDENTWADRYILLTQKNKEIKEFITWDQCYDKDSISKLLLENGFGIEEIKTDLMNNDEHESLFIIARKKI